WPRTTGNIMNSDHLTGNRRRPIRARLNDAVDGFGLNVDEFVVRRIGRLDTENLMETVLYARACSRTNPVVLADHGRKIRYWIAVRRSAEIRALGRGLVVLGDLVAV